MSDITSHHSESGAKQPQDVLYMALCLYLVRKTDSMLAIVKCNDINSGLVATLSGNSDPRLAFIQKL